MQPPSQTNSAQSVPGEFQVFWGGPDRPQRILRNLLEERIDAVPGGGEILWATYYFRDEGLAAALLRALGRGVRVRVALEGDPRTGDVNKRVATLLKGPDGLGENVRLLKHPLPDNRFLRRCRLHEKLYYFSHPVPCVLTGTFNPSGNQPEDSTVIEKIGDQDRGHNVLVELRDPLLVKGLYEHADVLFSRRHGPWERFLSHNNRVISSGKTHILFFPRSQWQAFNALFDGFVAGDRLRMAASHLNDRRICRRLSALARQGIGIKIIAHDTKRRVPSWVEREMNKNGIVFNRYVHPEGLPMHNKFMLFNKGDSKTIVFGSMNLSVRSLYVNHEILVVDKTPVLFEAFSQRWDEMQSEMQNMD